MYRLSEFLDFSHILGLNHSGGSVFFFGRFLGPINSGSECRNTPNALVPGLAFLWLPHDSENSDSIWTSPVLKTKQHENKLEGQLRHVRLDQSCRL